MTKNSKTPFDLLKDELTANLADLWSEYAIALKKVPCFKFSMGLQKEVDEFFHSSTDYAVPRDLPSEKLVLRLTPEIYRWLYRYGLIGDLLEKTKLCIESVYSWLAKLGFLDTVVSEGESFDTIPLDDVVNINSMDDIALDDLTCSLGNNQDEINSPLNTLLPVKSHDTSEPVTCTSFSDDVDNEVLIESSNSVINFILVFTLSLLKSNAVYDHSASLFKRFR